ncbi:hypothetical protein SDC9_83752 [bioreactor metagenome]|uniref:Type II secretion system protein J n=1 Tax=bioreactor metagenome TaxID=1076179 RepID=A0A644Z8E3_9ZZZZ
MLVVMVLLSIIMLAMVSGLRSAGQSSERVDAKLEQQDEVRVAERFVRNTLGHISLRPLTGGSLQSVPQGMAASGSGKPPILFEGAPTHVAWVGVLPARYGAGGRSYFRLSLEPVGYGGGLVIRYLPWSDQPNFPDWGGAASQVLLTDVTGLSIQYENDRPMNVDASSEWEGAWSHPDYAPARVVIDIQRGSQAPLEWVVPLWGLPASRPGGVLSGEDVIGGSV